MSPATVAVLFGGVSAEHSVSLKSGAAILRGLAEAGYRTIPVLIARDGRWCFVDHEAAVAGFGGDVDAPPAGAAFVGGPLEGALRLQRENVAVAFLGLHGRGGEDGALQGFLETAGIPYTGPGVAASAVAMDKLLLKRMLRGSGLPTADWIELESSPASPEARAADLARACAFAESGGWPVVVKAPTLGSSVGVALAANREELSAALAEVRREGAGVFVERGLRGVEVSCAAFGAGDSAFALPAIEIVPRKAGWFDFASKYAAGGALERIPAQIRPEDEERVRALALRVHRLLGADGFTRTDMIVGDDGPSILETNTLPGMTQTSLVPQEARAIGWSFSELVRRIVENARARRLGAP